MSLKFEVTAKSKDTNARCATLSLAHGDVATPVFMPVGTLGAVKALNHDVIEKIGFKLILANTYHLYLRPGMDVIDSFNGLHNFSSWGSNLLTDSGGFQVFSLSKLRKIKDEGVEFQSHIDGSKHFFTPEKVVDIQGIIGSDIAMCLDVCTPYGINWKKAKSALVTTHAWAKRSIDEYNMLKKSGKKHPDNLFGIVQGNFFEDLRAESAAFISSLDFDGIAIGGLSVGESVDDFKKYLRYTAPLCDYKKPKYVMGIGTPEYIFEAVENGIDMFDCVLSTRIARHASVFTDEGLVDISKSKYAFDDKPIVYGCKCTCCQRYSRGFLNHTFRSKLSNAGMLASEHNLYYLYNLMQRIRESIKNDTFSQFKKDYLEEFGKKR